MGPGLNVVAPQEEALQVRAALAALDAADVAIDTTSLENVLALLAGGRLERVRMLLRNAGGPALPLVLARYIAWTGDLHTGAAAWPAARAAMDALIAGDDAMLAARSTAELAAAATDLGDAQYSATLVGAGRRLQAQLPAPDHAVLRFVHGRLGAEPDATRHRLRLRPRGAMDVRQLRFGDGSVSLAVLQDDAGIRCTIEQDAGAIPVTVLLEPIVAGTVTGCLVDGKPAELAPRPHEGGTLVPVQLVLDDERTLEVRTSP